MTKSDILKRIDTEIKIQRNITYSKILRDAEHKGYIKGLRFAKKIVSNNTRMI